MTKAELSLLLYVETQAVDNGGKLQGVRMNSDDFETLKRWNESGFVLFGRIASKDLGSGRDSGEFQRTHWCVLSDAAWQDAHAERYARCARAMAKLTVQRLGLEERMPVREGGAA